MIIPIAKWPVIQTMALGLVLLSFGVSTAGCSIRRGADRLSRDSATLQQGESGSSLTFNDITLEQVDPQGRLLWRVKARQARYSQDQKVAKIQQPSGELFQDGRLVFRIRADQGEVRQDGQQIFLTGKIEATDTQDGAILRGQEMEWRPQEDLLIVRNTMTATHPQAEASANEARAFSRARRIEFMGKVQAISRDPQVQMRTERLVWQIAEQRFKAEQPIQMTRLETIEQQRVETDRLTGDQGEFNLKTRIAQISRKAQANLKEPPIQVNSDRVVWNLRNETIASDVPIRVEHQAQKILATADWGQMYLKPQTIQLFGNVNGFNSQNQSQLNADQLTWKLVDQEMVAEGNVTYRQNDPPLNLTGPRAVGKLDDQTIVVTNGQIITEISP